MPSKSVRMGFDCAGRGAMGGGRAGGILEPTEKAFSPP